MKSGCIENYSAEFSVRHGRRIRLKNFFSLSGDGTNGTVVLIGQDGLQLPPFSFPSGSLLAFLTCLEQGLSPLGRFDPPLNLASINSTQGPQYKRNLLTEKIAKLGEEVNGNVSQDFVFRLINGMKTSAVGKG